VDGVIVGSALVTLTLNDVSVDAVRVEIHRLASVCNVERPKIQ